MKVATAQQMAELDRTTIEHYGIPSLVLMENAGRSCVERILHILEDKTVAPQEASIAVVCGKGNNGGDGMVIARHLHNRGVYVEVFLLCKPEDLSLDARIQADILRKIDLEIRFIRDREGIEDLRAYLEEVHLCVDAIFGTGLSAPVSGITRDVIEVINLSMATVFAVDIPSGIDASTGRILNEAVRADFTGVFGLLKLGNVLLPGSIHCGETDVYDIGIPSRAIFDADIKTETIDMHVVKSMLAIRPPDFHKGDAGRVYVVGGSPGMTGAPCLSGAAALRMGAGLVTVVVPASLRHIVESKQMEVMSAGIPDDGGGYFTPEMIPALLKTIANADFVVVGPGLGMTESSPRFIKELLPQIKTPFLLDADALNALVEQVHELQTAGAPCIITPHTGEMSRLTHESVEAIEANRMNAVRYMAEEENVTVILKGPRSLVATPQGDTFINMSGNPYMASAGMGDALAGMIAALASQGFSPADAACAGVFLHGLSADLLVRKNPMTPVTATDVIENIKGALKHVLDEAPPEE